MYMHIIRRTNYVDDALIITQIKFNATTIWHAKKQYSVEVINVSYFIPIMVCFRHNVIVIHTIYYFLNE